MSVIQTGTPNIWETPAMPLNWVISAPKQATASVTTESHAQGLPKQSRINSPWPRPVNDAEPDRQFLHDKQNGDQNRPAAATAYSPIARRFGRR